MKSSARGGVHGTILKTSSSGTICAGDRLIVTLTISTTHASGPWYRREGKELAICSCYISHPQLKMPKCCYVSMWGIDGFGFAPPSC